MALGVPGQRGRTVMGAPVHPLAPGNVTVLLLGLVACPVLERAGRAVVAMTTSQCAQVIIIKAYILIVDVCREAIMSHFKGRLLD